MGPFTLILEKDLQLAIPEKKFSFGVDCESLLEKYMHAKEANFEKLCYMTVYITAFSVNFFDL